MSLPVSSANPLLWRCALSSALWSAICGYLLESFRRRALRAESHWLSQSDGERQLWRELLPTEARRDL
jgi:hypothetical protein